MRVAPAEILLQRPGQVAESAILVVPGAEGEPVEPRQPFRQIVMINPSQHDGNDELVALDRQLEFAPALR